MVELNSKPRLYIPSAQQMREAAIKSQAETINTQLAIIGGALNRVLRSGNPAVGEVEVPQISSPPRVEVRRELERQGYTLELRQVDAQNQHLFVKWDVNESQSDG